MKPIFILGYMGAGKSTLGRKLAQALDLQFIDTDIFIENRFRERIADMFNRIGEEAFRKREHYIIEELAGMTHCVISTGGGVPCYHDNMTLMLENGLTVYLYASVEVLASRLEYCKRTRPTIRDKSGEELLEHVKTALAERSVFYTQAQIHISIEHITCEADEEQLAIDLAREIRSNYIDYD